MKKLLRAAAVAATVAGFAAPGVMASAQTVTVGTQGPDSKAKVSLRNTNDNRKTTKNNVAANFGNKQASKSGSVEAKKNTTVGDVTTGNASAANATNATLALDNTSGNDACGCAADAEQVVEVSTEGPYSPAYVDIKNKNTNVVKTTNNVTVNNTNNQYATTGSVDAYGNTTVGNITTGDAEATNETVVDLSIMN